MVGPRPVEHVVVGPRPVEQVTQSHQTSLPVGRLRAHWSPLFLHASSAVKVVAIPNLVVMHQVGEGEAHLTLVADVNGSP